jgi:hypothetical protein
VSESSGLQREIIGKVVFLYLYFEILLYFQ